MDWFAAAGTLGLAAEYFFKTTAVLTLALLAVSASRRRPAAFRHFVLSFALVGLLLLPLLSLAPVGWRTSLLPRRPAMARTPSRDVPSPMREAVEVPGRAPAITASGPAESPAGLPAMHAALRGDGPASPPPSGSPTSPPSEVRANAGSPQGWLDLAAAALWSAGLAVLVLRLAAGLAGAVKLTREATALGGSAWRILLERFLSLVSLKRQVRLRSHPQVFVPLTWGWRKPVVLMPADIDAWTEEERSSALFHELSHVKRADFLVMLLVRTSLGIFWWNPLCWVVYRELRREQEIACDELVLRAGIRPSTYAASLLAFRRSAGFRWNPSAALLGMLGRSSFHERLAAILKQKLTFKEVKMKTKIMLASAVVLAVAIVGTARPAAGIEKTGVTATVIETALPDAGSLDAVTPAAEAQETKTEKAVVQEKEKEKAKAAEKAKEAEKAEKEKAAIERKIAVTVKEGGKTPIVITITEGDEVKTLTLDRPLTITSGKDGHVLILTSEGKELQVLKGEPLRLEIKGGEIQVLKEGVPVKVGEGGIYKIAKEVGEEGSKIVFYATPEGKAAGEGRVAKVIKEGEGFKVVVGTSKDVGPTIGWTVKESGKEGKEGALWVTKEFSGKPAEGVWVSEGGKAFSISLARDKELLEKVRAIQEQVAAVKEKKLDFTALEKSLEKLEAELAANAEKLSDLKMKFKKVPGEFTVVKTIREDEAAGAGGSWVAKADEASTVAKIGVSRDDNTVQIVFSGIEAGEGLSTYPLGVAAVDKLKKDLPVGYRILESIYNEEAGTMTFKIAPPEGTKLDEKIIRKLVDGLKEEMKKK